jgi:DNA-binding PadR family transcriptional regulator
MGNIYRFIEPVVLLTLKEKGHSHGYELSESFGDHALTDAQIERAALYRTLRTLEANGFVRSSWHTQNGGPARRVYLLTNAGHQHLREWGELMGRLGDAMKSFSKKATRNGR